MCWATKSSLLILIVELDLTPAVYCAAIRDVPASTKEQLTWFIFVASWQGSVRNTQTEWIGEFGSFPSLSDCFETVFWDISNVDSCFKLRHGNLALSFWSCKCYKNSLEKPFTNLIFSSRQWVRTKSSGLGEDSAASQAVSHTKIFTETEQNRKVLSSLHPMDNEDWQCSSNPGSMFFSKFSEG